MAGYRVKQAENNVDHATDDIDDRAEQSAKETAARACLRSAVVLNNHVDSGGRILKERLRVRRDLRIICERADRG
jgi:hypothetical protein